MNVQPWAWLKRRRRGSEQQEEENPFEPPESTRGRKRRRTRMIGVALVTALVLSGATVAAVTLISRCSLGIAREPELGECVGVTDGSFVFDPALQHVTDLIKRENDRIRDQRAVTVAVLMPMKAPEPANLSIEQIRSYLEGAYTAQREENESKTNLKIRLVLANEGSHEQSWLPVTRELREMTNDEKPLVAVTGLGLSIDRTEWGARELSRSNLPMIAYLSADQLNSNTVNGLTRVTPSLKAELEAVADALKDEPRSGNAMLVYDRNRNDLYTDALKRDFQTEFRELWREPTLAPYDGTPGMKGIENQFNTIATQLCVPGTPDTVMFAGRAAQIPVFVTELRQRGCEKPITVITGSDSAELRVNWSRAQTDADVTVLYASVSDPTALADPRNPDSDQYRWFEDDFVKHFDRTHLLNGWAIMANDAMVTAAAAIHNTVRQSGILPDPLSVRGSLYQLSTPQNNVQGASGTFMIHPESGDRVSQRIPVIKLASDGSVRVLEPGS